MKSVEERTPAIQKSPAARRWQWLSVFVGMVVLWLAIGEGVTWYWYASHESKMKVNRIPSGEKLLAGIRAAVDSRGGYQQKEQGIGTSAQEMLKCSYGQTFYWADGYGTSALTVLEWGEHSYVGGVEDMHNPGICLGAAGWTIGASKSLGIQHYGDASCETTQWEIHQGGISMHAFSAVFRRFAEAEKLDAEIGKYWNSTRLRSVLSGRRDAPILIVLGYISDADSPFAPSPASRFEEILRAAFANSGSDSSTR